MANFCRVIFSRIAPPPNRLSELEVNYTLKEEGVFFFNFFYFLEYYEEYPAVKPLEKMTTFRLEGERDKEIVLTA